MNGAQPPGGIEAMVKTGCVVVWALVVGAVSACGGHGTPTLVPIGARIEVTRLDGGVVRGLLTARDERHWHLEAGSAARLILFDQITSVQLIDGRSAPRLPSAARFREITLPEGTRLVARLRTPIGSDTSLVNDTVEATLTEALLVDDVEILPVGSLITGIVTSAEPAGKRTGAARLAVWFRKAWTRDRDDTMLLYATLRRTGAGVDVRFRRGSDLSIDLDQDVDVRVPITAASR